MNPTLAATSASTPVPAILNSGLGVVSRPAAPPPNVVIPDVALEECEDPGPSRPGGEARRHLQRQDRSGWVPALRSLRSLRPG